MQPFEVLKLENQICFPLYAASKAVIRLHAPYLAQIDLTYTQYMAMTKIWEVRETSLRDLGIAIMLDSGTLTPVVKKLAQKGLVTRTRSVVDERVLLVKLTAKGKKLYEIAKEIPQKMAAEWAGEWADFMEVQRLSAKMLRNLQNGETFLDYLDEESSQLMASQ